MINFYAQHNVLAIFNIDRIIITIESYLRNHINIFVSVSFWIYINIYQFPENQVLNDSFLCSGVRYGTFYKKY